MALFRPVLALALAVAPLTAQSPELPLKLAPRPTEPAITPADLMTRLYQVADDSMGGRPTGSRGHELTTAYLAAEMRRLGLQPAGDSGSFYQNLPMARRGFAATSTVAVGSARWTQGQDFAARLPRGVNPRSAREAAIVVGGTLGDSTTYISADAAAGKIVVMRPAARVSMNVNALLATPGSRFAEASAYVIPVWDMLPPAVRTQLTGTTLGMRPNGPGAEVAPTLFASNAMVDALLAAAGQQGRMTLTYTNVPVAARNVVAILPGSDPRLTGQYVALGAHNDHDPTLAVPIDHDSARAMFQLRARLAANLPGGQTATPAQRAALKVNVDSLRALRPARPDSIKNGADDDGSGTVALLEIAEALATSPQKPKRSILFVWHAGEELGLLGARHYTDHPTVPLDSIVAQLNMDMVGRGGANDIVGGGPGYVQLVGSRRLSKELGDLVEAVNARRAWPFTFDYTFDRNGHPENIYCRSDHAMYARFGIPVTFFHTGLHPDYHQITDEPQYIDYDKLSQIAGFIRDVAVEVANRAERPALSVPKPDPTVPCRQ